MGVNVYLMEHEEYGDDANCIIINDENEIILEEVTEGLRELRHYDIRKKTGLTFSEL